MNEKGELTILTSKHGLLASYTTRKVCFLTISYSHNDFAELQIGKIISDQGSEVGQIYLGSK